MRKTKMERKTKETDIEIDLNIDGKGEYNISTSLKFFDHLLSSLAIHGKFDLKLAASGDDEHHIIEDVGIVLGQALKKSLRENEGIRRFGHAIVPMDDSLAIVAIDISGRSYLVFNAKFSAENIGDIKTEMIKHFLETFVSNARININVRVDGEDDHHKSEALFKSLALALNEATRINQRIKSVPSTKGILYG
ncbi:MAG: imidazoleglycerol-phosphate dehydratase HisB [Methanocellales archaeon]|nr:imidazoleglycerol-phosphate dehydratase HisB [Methanocellales archaeon]